MKKIALIPFAILGAAITAGIVDAVMHPSMQIVPLEEKYRELTEEKRKRKNHALTLEDHCSILADLEIYAELYKDELGIRYVDLSSDHQILHVVYEEYGDRYYTPPTDMEKEAEEADEADDDCDIEIDDLDTDFLDSDEEDESDLF